MPLYPALKTEYGEFSVDNIKNMLVNEFSIKLQSIKKEDLNVCKECEFRLICSDCRAHSSTDLNFEKPKHCKYVP
jgi:radical SAM protein with 4Fe4S-binding SPASM domain